MVIHPPFSICFENRFVPILSSFFPLPCFYGKMLLIAKGFCFSGMQMNLKDKVLVAQSHLTLRPHGLCSPPGSSVHGIRQARIQEWIASLFSRGSSWPRSSALQTEPPGKSIDEFRLYLKQRPHPTPSLFAHPLASLIDFCLLQEDLWGLEASFFLFHIHIINLGWHLWETFKGPSACFRWGSDARFCSQGTREGTALM